MGAASEAFLEVRLLVDILLDKLRGCKVDDDDVEGFAAFEAAEAAEAAEVTVEVAELAKGHRLGF